MEQKYLPIGSVCTLKGKNKKVMITGYYSVSFSGNLKINDYMGCAYPEGMLLPEFVCSFNHTDIESVDFLGFKNEEQETFKGLLNRLTGNTDENAASEFHKENDMFLTSNSAYSKLLFDENGVVMIADPVVEQPQEIKTADWKNIKFDENGYVISTGTGEDINNPFHKEYETSEPKEENNDNWKIFNNIEFDENGTVVSTDNNIVDKKDEMLNEIKFDENGTVISVKGEDLKQDQNFEQYRFDENGTLIAIGNVEMEETTQNNTQKEEYKFDENGVVVSTGNETVEEVVSVSQSQSSNGFEFDERGNVVAAPTEQVEQPSSTNIQFDENGTVVSA